MSRDDKTPPSFEEKLRARAERLMKAADDAKNDATELDLVEGALKEQADEERDAVLDHIAEVAASCKALRTPFDPEAVLMAVRLSNAHRGRPPSAKEAASIAQVIKEKLGLR